MALLRWLTFLLGSLTVTHSPAPLDFFLSSDASICSRMFFPLLESFDHAVSVLIDFPLNPKEDAPFYCIAYDYSLADCDGLCDYLRDVLWEAIFKLSASGGFRLELMYISCIVNIRSSLNHFHVFQLFVLLS